jgi:hypothetical protein
MRRRSSRALVAAVVAIGLAATMDAILSRESPGRVERHPRYVSGATVPSSPFQARDPDHLGTAGPLPRCTAGQIALSIEEVGGTPSAVIRHVWGKPCHLAPLRPEMTVRDRTGRKVRHATIGSSGGEGVVTGDSSPGFERLLAIGYLPSCNHEGPFRAFLNAGPYFAQSKLGFNPAQETCSEQWARAIALRAGYRVAGWTGSASVAKGRGESFYIWMTGYVSHSELHAEGYRVVDHIEGIPVYSDKNRLAWVTREATVWINAGPTEESVAPKANRLRRLVAASRALPFR